MQPNPIDKIIGVNLHQLRIKHGMKQAELGAIINVSSQQISKFENAENRLSASQLYEISRKLGVSMLDLLVGTEELQLGGKLLSRPELTMIRDYQELSEVQQGAIRQLVTVMANEVRVP